MAFKESSCYTWRMLPILIIFTLLLSCPSTARASGINQKLCAAYASPSIEDLNKAIEYCSHALAENASSAELPLIMANLLYRQGDYANALPFAQTALKLAPTLLGAHQTAGKIYTKTGDAAKALEHFEQALKLAPNNTENITNAGFIHWIKKDYKTALTFFNQAIALDTYNPQPYEMAGDCQSYLKDLDGALDNFKRASVLNPNPRIFLKVAELLSVMKNYPEASIYLLKTAKLQPNDPTLHERLAKTLQLAHLNEQAQEVYLHTALLYKRMGLLQKSKEMETKAGQAALPEIKQMPR